MHSAIVNTNVIDADAHVVETERVWDYLERSEEKYRPTLVTSPQNSQGRFGCSTARTSALNFLRLMKNNNRITLKNLVERLAPRSKRASSPM